jgi:hypothetical protein
LLAPLVLLGVTSKEWGPTGSLSLTFLMSGYMTKGPDQGLAPSLPGHTNVAASKPLGTLHL